MISEMMEQFKKQETFGVKVIVLPDGEEKNEQLLVETPLINSLSSHMLLLAIGDQKLDERRSIRDAIINGYWRMKGGKGKVAGLLAAAEEIAPAVAEDVSGFGFLGGLAKLGLKTIAKASPVSPLAKEPYTEGRIAEVISTLCKDNSLIIYIRRAYDDDPLSLRFLTTTLGTKLDTILNENKKRFLAVLCIRQKDWKGEIGQQLRDSSESSPFLQIIEMDSKTAKSERGKKDDTPEWERIMATLQKADEHTVDTLRHVKVYAEASGELPFTSSLLAKACGGNVTRSLQWLEKEGIIETLSSDGSDAVWNLTENTSRVDVDTAFMMLEEDEEVDEANEIEDRADDADEDKDSDDGEDTPINDDQRAANNLFDALSRVSKNNELILPTLCNLAIAGTYKHEAVTLITSLFQNAVRLENYDLLCVRVRKYAEKLLDLIRDDSYTEAEIQGVLPALSDLNATLEFACKFAWSPVKGALGNILKTFAEEFEAFLEEEECQRAHSRGRNLTPFVHLLSDNGRVKALSLSSYCLETRKRNTPGMEFLFRPGRDGAIAEILAAPFGSLLWYFCSNGEVISFPFESIDAIYFDEMDRIFENMSVCLELRSKWDQPSDYVLAACVQDTDSEGSAVLLINNEGQYQVIPRGLLPRGAGVRAEMGGKLLVREGGARWAVMVNPGDDVFIGSTNNNVLRLKGQDIIDQVGQVCGCIMDLGEEDFIAAAATAPSADGLSSYILVAADKGNGRLVPTEEFPYGHIGAKGVIGQKEGKRSGSLCTIESVDEHCDFILCSGKGIILRISSDEIPIRNRNTVGVKLMALDEDDTLVCGCKY